MQADDRNFEWKFVYIDKQSWHMDGQFRCIELLQMVVNNCMAAGLSSIGSGCCPW